MLRLSDYSVFTPEIVNDSVFLMLLAWLATVIGGFAFMIGLFEKATIRPKGRLILVVAGVLLVSVGFITFDAVNQAKDRVTASVQTWLEDGYGITASADEVDSLFRDRDSLVVKYDGELTPVAILDATGGAITIVSSESTKPLQPIR